MDPNGQRSAIRTGVGVIAVIGLVVLGACSSGTTKKASGTTTSAAVSTSAPDVTSGSTSATSGTAASGGSTTQVKGSGGALGDSCTLVPLDAVQTVLPGATAGTSTAASSTASMCKYEVDADHRLLIMVTSGPAGVMATTKSAVAKLSGLTKVAGLGDVGYSSAPDGRLDVHFFRGDKEVLISLYGQPSAGAALVALGRKVDAALK